MNKNIVNTNHPCSLNNFITFCKSNNAANGQKLRQCGQLIARLPLGPWMGYHSLFTSLRASTLLVRTHRERSRRKRYGPIAYTVRLWHLFTCVHCAWPHAYAARYDPRPNAHRLAQRRWWLLMNIYTFTRPVPRFVY